MVFYHALASMKQQLLPQGIDATTGVPRFPIALISDGTHTCTGSFICRPQRLRCHISTRIHMPRQASTLLDKCLVRSCNGGCAYGEHKPGHVLRIASTLKTGFVQAHYLRMATEERNCGIHGTRRDTIALRSGKYPTRP